MIKQSDTEKLFRELNPKKSDKFKLGLDRAWSREHRKGMAGFGHFWPFLARFGRRFWVCWEIAGRYWRTAKEQGAGSREQGAGSR
jgi:hypothetical protein